MKVRSNYPLLQDRNCIRSISGRRSRIFNSASQLALQISSMPLAGRQVNQTGLELASATHTSHLKQRHRDRRRKPKAEMACEADLKQERSRRLTAFSRSYSLLFMSTLLVGLLFVSPCGSAASQQLQNDNQREATFRALHNATDQRAAATNKRPHAKRQIRAPDEADANLDEPATNHHDEPLALGLSNEQRENLKSSQGKRTLYACEEKQLEIECQSGESIQLIRANYGRFSIQICNEHGQLDWKVNCMSPDSSDIIRRSCQAKQSCQLLASNEIFGDACPGTQKYLEVHYQCVQTPAGLANRTLNDQQQQQLKAPSGAGSNQIRLPIITGKQAPTSNNVIQQTQQPPSQQLETGASLSAINSETVVKRPAWPVTAGGAPLPAPSPFPPASATTPQQLPNWMLDAGLASSLATSTASSTAQVTPLVGNAPAGALCPELVWRQLRWPATESGQVAQVACPGAASNVPYQASATLACLPGGQWASRAQAARCQSGWLRALTQRLETGDSPLSILNELVQRTHSTHATTMTTTTGATTATWAPFEPAPQSGLYGGDLIQIARIVARLTDEMVELLNGIGDDKQRVSFAREMIQRLVEVINNLSGEQQLEAWLDLATSSGERQRVAGQLVSSLESGCVLLAGALQQAAAAQPSRTIAEPEAGQTDFHKASEFVYVAIHSFGLAEEAFSRSTQANASSSKLQATFPSQASVLGTKWMNSEQRFTLNLQASQAENESAGSQQQLKVVFVMLRNLGAHMEPREQTSDSQQHKMIVNSDLVSFSIVADSRRSLKVDLSAPIELVFRHNNNNNNEETGHQQSEWQANQTPGGRATNGNCVYWDTTSSDWLSDGCKLVAANRTHSVCACNHLTTFGLLSAFNPGALASSFQRVGASAGARQEQQQEARVPLARLHLEAALEVGHLRWVHLAKLLDGNLFASDQATRTLLHLSCILAALMLALLLAAAAYNRAHARRLLGSMPDEPPPSLLVAHNLANAHPSFVSGANGSRPLQTAGLDMSQNPFGNSQHQQQALQSLESGPVSSQPTSYSSDANSNLSGQSSGPIMLQKTRLELGAANQAAGFYSLLAGADQRALSPQKSAPLGQQNVALVPLHVISKLFALQLLLLFLIESQTLLQQNVQAARRTFMQNSLLAPNSFDAAQAILAGQQPVLNPIGWPTWLLAFVFYYLMSTLLFWLLAQLIHLNGRLWRQLTLGAAEHRRLVANSAAASYQPIQMISGSVGVYQAQNRYGLCQMHGSQQPQQQPPLVVAPSGSSPTLSTFSANELGLDQQHLYATNQRQQQQQQKQQQQQQQQLQQQLFAKTNNHKSNLESFYGERTFINGNNNGGGKTSYASQVKYQQDEKWTLWALKVATSARLNWTLIQLGPIGLSCALVWLANERAQMINQLAYTSSHASQLAYWPLLLDSSSWTSPSLLHLYCIPSICLGLGALALVLLRRHIRRGSALEYGRHEPTNSHHQTHNQFEAKQNGHSQYESVRAIEAALATKSARFACLTLLALLVLSSICWLSFFVHCHQSLSENQLGSGNSNTLILTFGASNLLLAALICGSQRRALRRAAQLAGWSRLLLAGSPRSSQGAVMKPTPSPSSTNSANSTGACDDAPAGYYTGGHSQHYGPMQNGGKLASSPSQHSLFVISRSRPTNSGPQVAYGQHYSHESFQQQQQHMMIAQQQQQHLYQQLALSQQQIYNSTSNLHQAQQQQPMANYARQQQHLADSQFHHLGANPQPSGQQQLQQHMTLRPQQQQMFARNPHDLLTMCQGGAHAKTLSSSSARQHQAQAGEADGPLVALASSTNSALQQHNRQQPHPTFGPTTNHNSASYPTAQTTEPRPSNGQAAAPTEPAANQSRPVTTSAMMMMNRAQNMSSPLTIGANAAKTTQPHKPNQYFASGQTHEFELPQEQHQHEQQQHFRRSNSSARRQQQQANRAFASAAMMIDAPQLIAPGHQRDSSDDHDDDHETNIYDVANCVP